MKMLLNLNSSKMFLVVLFLFTSLISIQGQTTEPLLGENELPDAARISNKSSGSIKKQDILDWSKLDLIAPYDSVFQVNSFVLTRVRKGATPIELKNELNGELTDSMKTLINTSLKGDKFYFEFIKGKAKSGEVLSFKALSFVID